MKVLMTGERGVALQVVARSLRLGKKIK